MLPAWVGADPELPIDCACGIGTYVRMFGTDEPKTMTFDGYPESRVRVRPSIWLPEGTWYEGPFAPDHPIFTARSIDDPVWDRARLGDGTRFARYSAPALRTQEMLGLEHHDLRSLWLLRYGPHAEAPEYFAATALH
jgi:hypothetical protein